MSKPASDTRIEVCHGMGNCLADFSRITLRISGRWRGTCKDGQSEHHHRSVASIGYSPSWDISIAAGNSFGDSAGRSARQRVRNWASDRSVAIANLGEVENVGNPVELVRRLAGAAVEKAASEAMKILKPGEQTQATYHQAGAAGQRCIAPPCFQASHWFSRITVPIT
ncbi:hypothetical protein SAMN06265222_107315 [Neorhodopirellula lusitana]|uniref:Uncharacterized protein n=1 Tax=Neorhodopirellula lusitana TaxID=445327 RepID=A0ABY1Q936_9BACT|nr:hypothetical protein SAMN06265222_107315 [Neorhodopirellula lusitana]